MIQLAQRKADDVMHRTHADEDGDDVIFVSALELSMFTRRPRKQVGSNRETFEQRYSNATVLLAMSRQHGCIAFNVWYVAIVVVWNTCDSDV